MLCLSFVFFFFSFGNDNIQLFVCNFLLNVRNKSCFTEKLENGFKRTPGSFHVSHSTCSEEYESVLH